MRITPIFGFKGYILPVIDKDDKLYLFIKNDCDHRILLNCISVNSNYNKFINLEKTSTKLLWFGFFDKTTLIKVFYLGHELFSFTYTDINTNVLKIYSEYIINNNIELNKMSVNLSFLNGCKVEILSNTPQKFFIQIIDADKNIIIYEDNFVSGEPYEVKSSNYINYFIKIFNSTGEEVYNFNIDLTNKNVLLRFDSITDEEEILKIAKEFKRKHNCKIYCSCINHEKLLEKYSDEEIIFISKTKILRDINIFASYKF